MKEKSYLMTFARHNKFITIPVTRFVRTSVIVSCLQSGWWFDVPSVQYHTKERLTRAFECNVLEGTRALWLFDMRFREESTDGME
jgi:hypothetical protein